VPYGAAADRCSSPARDRLSAVPGGLASRVSTIRGSRPGTHAGAERCRAGPAPAARLRAILGWTGNAAGRLRQQGAGTVADRARHAYRPAIAHPGPAARDRVASSVGNGPLIPAARGRIVVTV